MKQLMVLASTAVALLIGAGTATAAPRFIEHGRHAYKVAWTVQRCPVGYLCKQWEIVEPNRGQALRLERLLEADGWRVRVVEM